MKCLVFLAALSLFSAEYGQSQSGSTKQSSTLVRDVSFCQLAKDPAGFQGKNIRVRGIYRYVLEMSKFSPAECCPGKGSDLKVIVDGNPMYPDSHSQRLARKLTAQMSATALVVFVGTMNGHVLEVDRVEKIEQLFHPKDRNHEPTWAAVDCGPNDVPSE